MNEAVHRVGDFSIWILLYMSAIFYAVTLIQDCHGILPPLFPSQLHSFEVKLYLTEEMAAARKKRETLVTLMKLKLSVLKDYPDVIRANIEA
jgi:hypothetical protein